MSSGRSAPAPIAGGSPWWRSEVVRFADIGRRWLKARFPTLRTQHDDLLGDAIVQLTAELSGDHPLWPASWFNDNQPSDEDVKRFHGLAFTVLKRRVQDVFRHDYRDWMQSLEDLPEELMPALSAPDAATALSHTRAIRALLSAMQAMSLRDRLLIERVAMGDKSTALTGAERDRVYRLRATLRAELGQILGGGPSWTDE
jgi:hypothetical protein